MKAREEEIKKIITTPADLTGKEEIAPMAWGVSQKNYFKCYSCGSIVHQGEPMRHFKTVSGKPCEGSFTLMY